MANDEHREPIEGTLQSAQAEDVEGDLTAKTGKALLFNAILNNGDWPKQTVHQALLDAQELFVDLRVGNLGPAQEAEAWHQLIQTAVVRVSTLVADCKLKLIFNPGEPAPDPDAGDMRESWKPAQWEYKEPG